MSHTASGSGGGLDDDQLCPRVRHRLHQAVHESGHRHPVQGKKHTNRSPDFRIKLLGQSESATDRGLPDRECRQIVYLPTTYILETI